MQVSEEECISVSFDPAAMADGCQGRAIIKYSTADTRQPLSGMLAIKRHLDLLESAHLRHKLTYSKQNPLRDYKSEFNICVGGRNSNASIVVPSKTLLQQAGHFVDCRPASNMDPYLVTAVILATTTELPLHIAPQPHVPVKDVQVQQRACGGGLRAAFTALQGCCFSNESAGISEGSAGWESDCPSFGSMSEMKSEEMLIDELDKALLGPDTPPMYGESILGGSLVMVHHQQRKRRGCYVEGFDESSSSGTSPIFLS